jgi:hypothetical protein
MSITFKLICTIGLIFSIADQSEHEKTISVLLNGVESTVEILDDMDIQVYIVTIKTRHYT